MKLKKATAGLFAMAASAGLMLGTTAQADVQLEIVGNGFFLEGGSFGAGPYQADGYLFQLIWHPTGSTGQPGPGGSLDAGEVLLLAANVSGSANGYYGYVGLFGYANANFNGLYTDAAAGVDLDTGVIFSRAYQDATASIGSLYFQSIGNGALVEAPPPPNIPPVNRIDVSNGINGAEMTSRVVPEPGVLALVLVGLGTIAYRKRKQRVG